MAALRRIDAAKLSLQGPARGKKGSCGVERKNRRSGAGQSVGKERGGGPLVSEGAGRLCGVEKRFEGEVG